MGAVDDRTAVDSLYRDLEQLKERLEDSASPYPQSVLNEVFSKVLLIAAASFFEKTIRQAVEEVIRSAARGNDLVVSFTESQAIQRKYHTWFDWDCNNANQFWKMFGREFAEFARGWLNDHPEAEKGLSDFLELGGDRNRLVHDDFASFTIEKTAEEIFSSYRSAIAFARAVSEIFTAYLARAGE
jgi:hypothetical protein